jgi:hypothetical protein
MAFVGRFAWMCELSKPASSTSLWVLYVQATPVGKTLLMVFAQNRLSPALSGNNGGNIIAAYPHPSGKNDKQGRKA